MAIPNQYNSLQHAMQWSCQNPPIHIDTTKQLAHLVQILDFRKVMITHCPPQAYVWNLDSMGFPYSLRTPETMFGQRSYGRPKFKANNQKNENCFPPENFLLHTIACWSTLNEFLSPKGSEFVYTYFEEICSPISLVYPKI